MLNLQQVQNDIDSHDREISEVKEKVHEIDKRTDRNSGRLDEILGPENTNKPGRLDSLEVKVDKLEQTKQRAIGYIAAFIIILKIIEAYIAFKK